MLQYLCDCFFTCCSRIKHHYIYITLTLCCRLVRTIGKLSQSACWPSVLITLMAVADYFGLHCCRPAAFTQQVCNRVGDTGTGSRAVALPSNGWLLHGNPSGRRIIAAIRPTVRRITSANIFMDITGTAGIAPSRG